MFFEGGNHSARWLYEDASYCVRGRRNTGLLRWCAVNMLGAVIVTMLAMPDKAAAQRAIVLEIDGVIGPAVANYIVRELRTVARGEVGSLSYA